MIYEFNQTVSVNTLSDLRESVGWSRMENEYKSPLMTSYYHIAAYDKDELVGYIDCVSNGVTDAYIQDLMVHPDYQGKGIGTDLMNKMIGYLKEKRIYMISVVFEERLKPFYEKFGFYNMLCGQMETYSSN
ncbi:MAG: GNAT family N-acetyltransferase [Oscillospiraceae bacterium]|nr:GNAT family N-acetyltransferase [Oscillospiraceae bacterium]